MKVHLYTMSKNETDMLGFFFRHFDSWVDRYVIYDDGSTDGTLELLKAHPRVEVRPFPRFSPDSFVESAQMLHNGFWKESRGSADWVVVTAIDEHLHLPGREMRDYLWQCVARRITCIPALGYQMVSEEFPQAGELLCETRRMGVPYAEMSKLSLFNPSAVKETNYAPGRHAAAPTGDIRYPETDDLLNLHYKLLDFERTCGRQRFLNTGLGKKDVANSWGYHYAWSNDEHRKAWDSFATRVFDITTIPPEKHDSTHREPRWWRPAPVSHFL